MKRALYVLTALIIAACETAPEPPAKEEAKPAAAPKAPATKPAKAKKAKAAPKKGTPWSVYKAADYGIQLRVPETSSCKEEIKDEIGHLHCDYGTMGVHVLAYDGAMTLDALKREAAKIYDDVPYGSWTFEKIDLAGNGYKSAEAWSASQGGSSVVGVAAQTTKGTMNHVAFIYGTDEAWKQHAADVEKFVEGVKVTL